MKHRRRSWWKKCKERIVLFFTARMKEEKKEKEGQKEGQKEDRRPRTTEVLGKSGRSLFLLISLAQNWLCVNAAEEGLQKRTEMTERWQHQNGQVKESRWAEESPQRWKQPKGEDRTEMKKEAKLLRCTLLNGSAWSTERKYMRRYKRKCDIFFGREHRLRKEEMEDQFNKEAKEGWRLPADAARITDERASSEDGKHTSGGVFVAVDSSLGAVVGAEEGATESIPGNEGRIAQTWVNVGGGGSRVFSVYFWHSEGWTPRNEGLAESSFEASKNNETLVVDCV